MRYAGKHLRPFADLALNTLFHFDKGKRGLSNLGGTVGFECFIINAFTEIFCHLCEFGNRTYLNPQEQHSNQEQQQRRDDHPDYKEEH